jgi:hypothetical protein
MAIKAELRLGIRDFNANLDRASQNVKQKAGEMKKDTKGIGRSLVDDIKAALPALSFAALGAGIKAALTRADDIADLKIALGETAETLQRVDYAAQQTASVGVEDLAKAMIKLEKNLGDLDNKAATEALANFGVTAAELARMPLDEKLIALSGAFQKARAEGTGVKDIMDLLGRSGASLIPMLAQSEEALRDLFEGAPAVADELIDRMAVLNDQFDGMIAKAKSLGMEAVGGLAGWAELIGDVASEGSLDAGFAKYESRDAERMRGMADQRRAKEAQAEALERQQAAAAAQAAADEREKAGEEAEKSIAKIKEELESEGLDLLPDDEKIAALQSKLAKMLRETVGLFSLKFETSTAGLEQLALAREGNAALPAEGQNSAQEAYEWLAKSRDIEKEIADLKSKTVKEELDAAKKREDELAAAREQAAAGGFALLDPEQQAARLREQLEGALGLKVGSSADLERGLATQRQAVADAKASGDTEAEMAALERLSESQRLAKEFSDSASALAPEAPAGGVGSLAGLVNQIFGRDPQAQQVEVLNRVADIAKQQRDRLDTVIKKMDEQPPVVKFADF